MTSKIQLIGNITTASIQLCLLEGDAAEIAKARIGLGNLMLDTYKTLLSNHDTVPLHAWEDLCEANDWAHTRTDPVTHEVTKIKGDKPQSSVKSFNTWVRKYFSKFRHLDVESMTELRKALKGKVNQVERHVKSIQKLPVIDIMAIMARVSSMPSVQKAVEEVKAEADAKRKLVKKAA